MIINMKFKTYRIFLTRVMAGIAVFFLCTSQSYFEEKNDMITFFMFFMGLILVAIASLGRMWCSLYIGGYKNNELITQGPYSICRNPLYFFSMLGLLGIGFCTETFTFPAVFIVLFMLYYPFVIKGEESRLRQLFGHDFDKYAKRVPSFFPRFSTFDEPENYNVNPVIYRKHMFSALWFIWIIAILELIEGIRETGLFKPLWYFY